MKEFGPYELIEEIGVGGMAEVWLGREKESSSLYAIKRIHPHLAKDPKFIEMFIDEAKIGKSFNHPNIAKVMDVGIIDDVPYMTMEFLDGKDLAFVLDTIEDTNFEIAIGVALEITIQILDALGYAHRYEIEGVHQNIIHRDISPHNILISKTGRVSLLDFGVAKALDRNAKTETGVVKGKLSYMSPEQVKQEKLDHRADLFSMGVVLYELLTLATPFGRELKAVHGIMNHEAPDPRELRSEIPIEISCVVGKALEKAPDARFQSAFEMATELREIMANNYPNIDGKDISGLMSSTLAFSSPEKTSEDFTQNIGQSLEVLQNEVIEEDKKQKRFLPLIVAALIAIALGLGLTIYQAVSSKTTFEDPLNPKEHISQSTDRNPAPKVQTPPFRELLDSLSIETSVPPDISDNEMKRVLKYRFDNRPESYLIGKKTHSLTQVFETSKTANPEKEHLYVDPGDPNASFDLKTTAAEREQRRAEKKKLGEIRDALSEKKQGEKKKRITKKKKKRKKKPVAKKKPRKKKKKRKNKFIDKVIPAGL